MIAYAFYESDNRVIRYAKTLAERGNAVDVFALLRAPSTPTEETIDGVRVFRIQMRSGKKERSKTSFVWPLLRFLFRSSWELTRRHRRQPYAVVHVHNIPDFLVFAAWYPKLTGAGIILDIHDIVPEFFASKFRAKPSSLFVRGLLLIERASAAFADHIIIANHLWLEKYIARSARREKCSVFINHVDETIFRRQPSLEPSERQIILFPGGLQWHQGLDLAILAFAQIQDHLPKAEFHIYGDGSMKAELVALTNSLGLSQRVRFFEPLSLHRIAEVMALSDLGVVPKRADSFGNEAYSTKIMEFMSVGVPVVVSDTKIDRYYFNDSVVRFFESGNPGALAMAMQAVLGNSELRQQQVACATEYVAQHSWESRKPDYFKLVDSLCQSHSI